MNDGFERILRRVSEAATEEDVRSALQAALIAASGGTWSLEVPSSDGSVDMLSRTSRILVETKAPGRAHPDRPGAKAGETQRNQVERYLRAVAPDSLVADEPNWRGFLTDGQQWWGWEWEAVVRALRPLANVQARAMPRNREEFDRLLASMLGVERRQYPSPPPDDLANAIFDPVLGRVADLQRLLEGEPVYDTRLGLWASLLDGSGIAPPGDTPLAQARTFASHSLLVATARILIGCLDEPAAETARLVDRAGDGFQGWLAETPGGREILAELVEQVRGYDWRGSTKDVLKDAYHGLIAAEDRKVFGEFYTPDDLARLVVEEVLDDEWCDQAIGQAAARLEGPRSGPEVEAGDDVRRQHLGVLDPSCGSGTFLFHAARRLGRRIRMAHKPLLARTADIVALLVHGVDLHPVAVEMARATLSMALPASASGRLPHLQVVLGDAMRTHEMKIDQDLGVRVRTPGGKDLWIPASLALHPRRAELISGAVADAVRAAEGAGGGERGVDSPPAPVASRTPSGEGEDPAPDGAAGGRFEAPDAGTAAAVAKLASSLAPVIRSEGNHVWAWHLLNNADLFQLRQHGVGRLIGNPPWLVSPYTPEGPRKDAIEAMRIEEGVQPTRRTSARGDLASVFTARAARLYLCEREGLGRYGWVLPGSALINDTWAPWRSGRWSGVAVRHTEAWNLDQVTPPVFPHAPNGTCVVLGERVPARAPGVGRVLRWNGPLETAEIRELTRRPSLASLYEKEFRIGALSKPQPLLLAVEVRDAGEGLASIRTKLGTKAAWKGLVLEGVVEAEVLLPLVRSQELRAFGTAQACTWLVAPRTGGVLVDPIADEDARERLPRTFEFWRRAEAVYQERRSARAGRTLAANLDFKGTLTSQLAAVGRAVTGSVGGESVRKKLLYNASGATLRAARVPVTLTGNQKTYWTVADSEGEALYLCGVLNARCMQAAWREGKTSKLDFDKSLWRHVPVPKHDPEHELHRAIADAAGALEDGAGEAGWKELDRCVAALLPEYAEQGETAGEAMP